MMITPQFMVLAWLAMIVLFVLIEFVTVSLVSVWFVGGALIALLAALLGLPLVWQILLFFIISFVLLSATRPFVLKYVKPHNIKTNYEQLIGEEVKVTERVDNHAGTGKAEYHGQEWSARSVPDDIILEAGEKAVVQKIQGVHLFVARKS